MKKINNDDKYEFLMSIILKKIITSKILKKKISYRFPIMNEDSLMICILLNF